METQTRFDLETAIANWREELAAQADLTPIVRRELETHLRDTTRELQGHGLGNEESFWLARRRLGKPQQLEEEFAKADTGRVWRDRAFWMSVMLTAEHAWLSYSSRLWSSRHVYPFSHFEDLLPAKMVVRMPGWVNDLPIFASWQILIQLVCLVPLFIMIFLVANFRTNFVRNLANWISTSRIRFVLLAVAAFYFSNSFNLFHAGAGLWIYIGQGLRMGLPVALGVWLIRPKDQMVAKIF